MDDIIYVGGQPYYLQYHPSEFADEMVKKYVKNDLDDLMKHEWDVTMKLFKEEL